MNAINIDHEKCILCETCVGCCPFQALNREKDTIQVQENCFACAQCIEACPENAIRLTEHKEDERAVQWRNILVYLESQYGQLHPISYQLIGKAHELAQTQGCDVYGIYIGEINETVIRHLSKCSLEMVYVCEAGQFLADVYEQPMIYCIKQIKPSIVMIGGTPQGRSLAPRVATHFRTGLTADCTELLIRERSELVQIRPAYGGNIMAQIRTSSRPQMATVRYNVFPSAGMTADKKTALIFLPTQCNSPVKILGTREFEAPQGIAEQEVLVVAGNGIKKKEDLGMLQELAQLMDGELASTRGLVEKGWMPPSQQIGLSGHAVSPKLLLTCGVSGSVQFMAGASGAKNIIAINEDKHARIFQYAHYPICGDLYEIIPELIKQIKQKSQ